MSLKRDWKRFTGWATAAGAVIAVLSTGYTWIHGIRSEQVAAIQQAEQRHSNDKVHDAIVDDRLSHNEVLIKWLMDNRSCRP